MFAQKRYRNVSNIEFENDDKEKSDAPEYCIDAGFSGNVARFINHSCEPNLFVQCVLSSHHDVSLARIVLFAADNISPLHVICLFSTSSLNWFEILGYPNIRPLICRS